MYRFSLLLWSLLLLSCNVNTGGDPTPEPSPTPCTDNDGDGVCEPEDCNELLPDVHPGATELCDDGLDNDCSGGADCADPSCSSLPECDTVGDEICNDGQDNDRDSWTDCDDPDCFGQGSCGAGTCQGQQLLVDPSFENQDTAWVVNSNTGGTVFVDVRSPTAAHGGSWYAWIGGIADDVTSLRQEVTVPANGSGLSLDFWWAVLTNESYGLVDLGELEILNAAGSPLDDPWKVAAEDDTQGVWQHATLSLTPYLGQTISLRWTFSNDYGDPTSLLLDDVHLICN